MKPYVTKAVRYLAPVTFAFLAWIGFTSTSGAASALEPALASAPAVQTLQDVESEGLWSVEEGATHRGGQFVCMAEFDDDLPACERNADGTWDCWGELGNLGWRLVTCAAGFGIPAIKAWRAADAAYDSFRAARAAKKASVAAREAGNAAAGAAVSVASSALAAVLGDILCVDILDLINSLWDCIQA